MTESKARAGRSGLRETISFVGWHLIMLIWLAGWLLGVVWVWPVIARLELDVDLISAVFWLGTGAVAWVVAFTMGYRRYW
jgi:hypothetical protein